MDASKKPRLSRFAYFVPLGECTALYNALNMAVIFLGNETAKSIQQGNLSPISEREKELIGKAVEEKMLVGLDHDDLVNYRKIQGRLPNLPISILYLLTTDQCNFACRYCFIEGNFPADHKPNLMTSEVAQAGIPLR